MRGTTKTRRVRGAAFLLAGAVALGAAGCGGEDFKRTARPPVALELTGVIQRDKVTVSPNRVGAGPVSILISNQTDAAHTVTLAGQTRGGGRIEERVGPINPLDTASIQKTLRPGAYEVRAGSEAAVPKEIAPARLTVGRGRANADDRVLLP
jgi:hypothetical protein